MVSVSCGQSSDHVEMAKSGHREPAKLGRAHGAVPHILFTEALFRPLPYTQADHAQDVNSKKHQSLYY